MLPSTRRGLLVFVLGVALLLAAFVFDYWRSSAADGAGLAGVSLGGPFALTDQNGVLRHDGDFRGKLMLVYFGYTYCPDACPTELATIGAALDMLGESGKAVQPIFITVDPARDTVAQLKSYAANFTPRLLALTGTDRQIAAAARAYRVYFAKVRGEGEDDYAVDHSAAVFLMGRDGKYLAHFGPDATAGQMAAAIKKHL
jgi:cytochrome oxidase Cu insertion factor (SCO1/SenC/PrrC family)